MTWNPIQGVEDDMESNNLFTLMFKKSNRYSISQSKACNEDNTIYMLKTLERATTYIPCNNP